MPVRIIVYGRDQRIRLQQFGGPQQRCRSQSQGNSVMVKYSAEPKSDVKSSKSRASNLRVHFKHCREVSHAIKGMTLEKAKKFLEDVLEYKQAVPFTKFTGGCGRHAQGKLNANIKAVIANRNSLGVSKIV